jgi:putative flippase GtrA
MYSTQFHSRHSFSKEFILVFGLSSVAYVGNIGAFYLLYAFATINLIVAKILGTCFGFVFNYAARQFFVFSRVSRFVAVSEAVKFGNLTTKAENHQIYEVK